MNNTDFEPLSPVSDNAEWMKYIDSDAIYISPESDFGSTDESVTGSVKQEPERIVFDSYIASYSSPEDDTAGSCPKPLDLNTVNHELTANFKSTVPATTPGKKSRKRAPRKKLTSSQKAAHNIIEKKYRININTKIEGLQRLIPWLTGEETGFRTQNKNNNNEETMMKKLNKSLILDKAIEYIEFLQLNETRILEENSRLKKQLYQMG